MPAAASRSGSEPEISLRPVHLISEFDVIDDSDSTIFCISRMRLCFPPILSHNRQLMAIDALERPVASPLQLAPCYYILCTVNSAVRYGMVLYSAQCQTRVAQPQPCDVSPLLHCLITSPPSVCSSFDCLSELMVQYY